MLIVFGGLPGTGKSSIARLLASRLRATYIRIDTVEQALRCCATMPAGVVTEGYAVGYRVAEDNLRCGCTVIADSVNPLAITRDAWAGVAARAGVPVVEVELVCSDLQEHRRRVETRGTDVPGLALPTWDAVQRRDYEPWTRPHIVLDTALQTVEAAVETLCQAVQRWPATGT
jgi:predicted kinase